MNSFCDDFTKATHKKLNFFLMLQAKKTGGEGGTKAAEQAEALLLVNKQFTDLTSFLTPLVSEQTFPV